MFDCFLRLKGYYVYVKLFMYLFKKIEKEMFLISYFLRFVSLVFFKYYDEIFFFRIFEIININKGVNNFNDYLKMEIFNILKFIFIWVINIVNYIDIYN